MDGTILRAADSPANREHFGAQIYPSGKLASYPQVRAVTLTAMAEHQRSYVTLAQGTFDGTAAPRCFMS